MAVSFIGGVEETEYPEKTTDLSQVTLINVNGSTSLTPPLFIEVSVPSQESEWVCITLIYAAQFPVLVRALQGASILPLSTILIFYFGIVVFHFITCTFVRPSRFSIQLINEIPLHQML